MTITDTALRRELRERMMGLNYHSFLMVIILLLERMGYEGVTLSGRTGWVGRNRDGGADLVASLPVPGGGKRRIVVQAKQFGPERRVYRRSVDEIRGVSLRASASEALLITTSSFSDSVPRSRYASAAVIPVRLVDGEELMELMALHKVGVWEEPGESADLPARRGIDESFFQAMERDYPGIARPTDAEMSEGAQLLLTLEVLPKPRRRSGNGFYQGTAKAALPSRR